MEDIVEQEAPLLRRPGRRLSDVLRDIEAGEGPRVAVGDIVGALGDRGCLILAALSVTFVAAIVTMGTTALTDLVFA